MQREGETGAMWGQEDEVAEPASLCPSNSFEASLYFQTFLSKRKEVVVQFLFYP